MHKRLTFLVCLCVLPAVANAQVNHNFNVASGDWHTASNWDMGAVPPAGDHAFVNNGGTATLSADTNDIKDLGVGQGTGVSGTLNHSAGTLSSADGWIRVGGDGGSGDYFMSGNASLNAVHTNPDDQRIFIGHGDNGDGLLDMSDNASITTNGWLNLSHGNGAQSVVNVRDNASIAANIMNFGNGNATVNVNQSGGNVTSNNWIGLGNFGGGTVTYDISGGQLISANDHFSVGEDGVGNLLVSGAADVQANGVAMNVGRNAAGTGLLQITGSAASVSVSDLTVDTSNIGMGGTLSWIADAGGISTITTADNVDFGANSFLSLDLTADSQFSLFGSGSGSKVFTLVDGASLVAGTFNGISEGDMVSIGGGKFGIISYGGGDGNDITITVQSVPEPSSLALIGLGVAAICSRRKRRA